MRGEFKTALEFLPLNDIAAPCQMTTGGVRCIKCNKRHVNSSACLVVDRTIAILHSSFSLGRATKIDAVLVFIGSCLGNANNFLSVHKYNTDLEWIYEACKFAAFWLHRRAYAQCTVPVKQHMMKDHDFIWVWNTVSQLFRYDALDLFEHYSVHKVIRSHFLTFSNWVILHPVINYESSFLSVMNQPLLMDEIYFINFHVQATRC